MVTELQEYARVRATGRFDFEKSRYIGPRPRSHMGVTKSGNFVITPFYSTSKDSNAAIMVLRGWAPVDWAELPSTGGSTATVEGVVRYSESPSIFVPENRPEKNEWYYIDVAALAKSMGLPEGTPLIEVVTPEEEAKQSGGKVNPTAMDVLGGRASIRSIHDNANKEEFPLAKSEGDMRHFSVMPLDHMNYALTWFSLSAATTGLAFKALRKR